MARPRPENEKTAAESKGVSRPETGRTHPDAKMTVQAVLIFVVLDIGFRLLGFPRVFLLVERWGQRRVDVASPAEQRANVRSTLEAVRTATRYYYRRRLDCLPRALAIFVLLRSRGVPATLRIGVKRYPFGGHAWVECLGEVLGEATDEWRHEPYVPILATRDPE